MQGFALLGGKALERRLEDENDKRRKLIEARCSEFPKSCHFCLLPLRHKQQRFLFLILKTYLRGGVL